MREQLQHLPIYIKANEILQLTDSLVKLLPEDNEFLNENTVRFMLEDSMTIVVKIAGVEAVDFYDSKMENAVLIRKAARNLYVCAGSLSYEEDLINKEYITLLRNEIEAFRLLFIDWVAAFDPWHYATDKWGLFNPPGVSPHDKNPDDDIPFDPNDLLDYLDTTDEPDEE